jgi:hypothetical protein
MIPDLVLDDPSEDFLPCGAKDLGKGFILLRARKGELCPLCKCEAEALCDVLPTTQRGVEISIHRWAKLQLTTSQNCNSAWKELEKPLKKHHTACMVKVCNGCIFWLSLCINMLNVLDTS